MLKSVLPKEVKVNITIEVFSLKSNLTTSKTIRFSRKLSFYTILGFTQSHSGVLCDIDGYIQLLSGIYKSERPVNITGVDKNHLKRVCSIVSVVNGIREPILYSFALDKPPGHKIYEEPRIKLF